MHFKFNHKDLFDKIKNVMRVVPTKSTNPVLSHILFELEGNTLFIKGTDLDVYMWGKVEVEGIEDGAFGVPGAKIHQLIKEFSEDDAVFKLENNKVNLQQHEGLYTISGIEKEDFPSFNIIQKKLNSFPIPASIVSRMIEKTKFAISTDMTRISLSALYWQLKPEEMRMVATDGHRLTLFRHLEKEQKRPALDLLLPGKTTNQLYRLLEEFPDKELTVTVGEKNILFNIDDYGLASHLIAEKFPNYEQVIPRDNDKKLIISKDKLADVIKRVKVFASPLTNLAKFSLNQNKLQVFSSDFEIGTKAHDELDISFEGDDIEIGFNSNYLLEVLEHIDSDDIKIMMKSPLSASEISPHEQDENEEYLSILMPLRLPEE
ncbi:DNA polymerase III subunit beta [bacterium]|nr:DNA polymerase III subunit beta [bacterium]